MPDKIKIFLHGEKYHAKVFCEQLENYEKGIFEPKYFEKLDSQINYDEFDLFHLISSPLTVIKKLNKYNKPILYHWIGTDVYRLINDSFIKKLLKKNLINLSNVKNLAVSENLKAELAEQKISTDILPLTKLNFVDEIPPLPERLTVLAYVPENRWDFYNGDLILKLAEKFPEINFHLLAADKKSSGLPNVFTYGFIEDVTQLYIKCSVLIRITEHDGLPKMVLEALYYGRYVLWSEAFPHCFKVNNLDDCTAALNKLKSDAKLNLKGKEYIEKNFNTNNILHDYFNLCRKLKKINE